MPVLLLVHSNPTSHPFRVNTQVHINTENTYVFASLKKSSFQDLLAKADNLNKSEAKGPDERLWKPEVDKAGNGYAVIRFLPAPNGEDLPWAQVWTCLPRTRWMVY